MFGSSSWKYQLVARVWSRSFQILFQESIWTSAPTVSQRCPHGRLAPEVLTDISHFPHICMFSPGLLAKSPVQKLPQATFTSDIAEATQLISYLLTVALTLLVLLFACSTQLGLFWWYQMAARCKLILQKKKRCTTRMDLVVRSWWFRFCMFFLSWGTTFCEMDSSSGFRDRKQCRTPEHWTWQRGPCLIINRDRSWFLKQVKSFNIFSQ